MTEYMGARTRGNQSWRREKVKSQWKSILALSIIIFLIFASINGLLKSFSVSKYLQSSKWDSKTPFVSVLRTEPVSVFVFNPEDKEVTFLKLSDDLYFESGDAIEPLVKLAYVAEKGDGEELARIVSLNLGNKIDNFVMYEKEVALTEEFGESFFKNITSFTKPIEILGGTNVVKNTNNNIERYDMFRLWWKTKGISINNVKTIDVSTLSTEVIINGEEKVLGVDVESLQFQISQYFENRVLKEDGKAVKILNHSNHSPSYDLAIDFVRNAGLEISMLEDGEIDSDKSLIIAKKSFSSDYLANIFSCDIVGEFNGVVAKEDEMVLVLGRDFTAKYFR